ncbi:MAG: 50S ribosomal protein L35 [Victivallales bacterium]|nr:50S ribosomal protein L35 [Victivallales bacterium]
MPKMKTRKCAVKRIKQTGTGKYLHNRAGSRHILTKKSSKRKRRLKHDGDVKSTEVNRIKTSVPYGVR